MTKSRKSRFVWNDSDIEIKPNRRSVTNTKELDPATAGIVATVLDECITKGDDETVDCVARALEGEGFTTADAGRIAYHVVHGGH